MEHCDTLLQKGKQLIEEASTLDQKKEFKEALQVYIKALESFLDVLKSTK
jgi:hypothetical protein